jgi:hypothetical protein
MHVDEIREVRRQAAQCVGRAGQPTCVSSSGRVAVGLFGESHVDGGQDRRQGEVAKLRELARRPLKGVDMRFLESAPQTRDFLEMK